jgi:hypothetical protein
MDFILHEGFQETRFYRELGMCIPAFCILVFAMAMSVTTQAQFNDTVNYYIKYSSTGTINKTNDGDSYVLNNNARFSIAKKRVSLNTSLFWIYGRQSDLLVNNDFTAALDGNLYNLKMRRLYYWGLALYESSFSLKIHDRLQTGAGLGYDLIDKPDLLVNVSDGVLYEKSNLYQAAEGGVSSDYETYRNSFRLKFRWVIKDRVTFEGTDFLQHSLSDRKDYIIKSNTNVSIKLIKWLSFTTSLTYNKITETQRENLLLNFGLMIEKYF